MDEQRIQRTGELLMEYSEVETRIMPIIQKCLDNIKENGKSVNGAKVTKKDNDQRQLIKPHKRGWKVSQWTFLIAFVQAPFPLRRLESKGCTQATCIVVENIDLVRSNYFPVVSNAARYSVSLKLKASLQ